VRKPLSLSLLRRRGAKMLLQKDRFERILGRDIHGLSFKWGLIDDYNLQSDDVVLYKAKDGTIKLAEVHCMVYIGYIEPIGIILSDDAFVSRQDIIKNVSYKKHFKAACKIQNAFRAHRAKRDVAARVIQDHVKAFLYRPQGAIFKRAKARFEEKI